MTRFAFAVLLTVSAASADEIDDLSATTKQAINLTRSYGGYLVTVDYGSGRKSGTAYLVLRIPIVKVQAAVVKLTSLGTILNDRPDQEAHDEQPSPEPKEMNSRPSPQAAGAGK